MSLIAAAVTGFNALVSKAPFAEGKKRYLELKDRPLPTPDTTTPDPPIVHKADGSVLWRFSDYEKIMQRVHDSHDAAIASAKATAIKHATAGDAAIDLTVPFSPLGETQTSPEPTPQPAAAAAKQPESAINALPSLLFVCASLSQIQSCVRTADWIKTYDPSGMPYYLNTNTHQVQWDAPPSGNIAYPPAPAVTRHR